MDERCSHERLGTECVYFVLWAHETVETLRPISKYRLTWRPFWNYASRNWERYVRKVEHESRLTHLVVSILEADPGLRKGFLLHLPPNDLYNPSLPPPTITACLDLYWPCKKLIEMGANVNKIEGNWGTSLQAASVNGNESVVQLLLDHGSDVDTEGGRYGCAIQAAILGNCKSIVQLLLDNGASSKLQGKRIDPLRTAIWMKHESIVRLLLDQGAEVNNEEGYYGGIIFRPISTSSPEIMVMLLEHGLVVSKFRGGAEAEDALVRKDLRRFVAIQIESIKIDEKGHERGPEGRE
jgi:hypothetical protein